MTTPLPPLLLRGDCLTEIRRIPDESVDSVVTSPPYYGLRDYGHEGQGGQEERPDAYVEWLTRVFDEVKRILAPTGTAWLNIGDSYANDAKWGGSTGGKAARDLHGATGIGRAKRRTGIPAKSLMGIPWRVALSLQSNGWIIRSDVIWEKPNAMPESVKDRPTKSYEHIFMLTKSARYFYNHEALREPAINRANGSNFHTGKTAEHQLGHASKLPRQGYAAAGAHRDNPSGGYGGRAPETRALRDVWRIPTKPYKGAHFATFPAELARRCIIASTPPGGIVVDPFAGSGTTLEAAYLEGFESIGVEMTPDYWPLIAARIERVTR